MRSSAVTVLSGRSRVSQLTQKNSGVEQILPRASLFCIAQSESRVNSPAGGARCPRLNNQVRDRRPTPATWHCSLLAGVARARALGYGPLDSATCRGRSLTRCQIPTTTKTATRRAKSRPARPRYVVLALIFSGCSCGTCTPQTDRAFRNAAAHTARFS